VIWIYIVGALATLTLAAPKYWEGVAEYWEGVAGVDLPPWLLFCSGIFWLIGIAVAWPLFWCMRLALLTAQR